MLEGLIAFVAGGTLPGVFVAEINGVLEYAVRCRYGLPAKRSVDRRMAKIAVIPYDLSFLAKMLAVVTTEAALSIEMADVVR